MEIGELPAVPTERPGDFYVSLLGLDRPNLNGKKILNIGAGGSDLQSDLKESGIEVINVDPRYQKGNWAGKLQSQPIAGNMIKLPLQDNSVDIAVALYSAGHPPRKDDSSTLSEMVRTAREHVIVYPCSVSRHASEFIEKNNLQDIVSITTPPFDPSLVLANLEKKRGFFSNLARLAKNTYYALDIEPLARLFGAKRITINTEKLKGDAGWEKAMKGLIDSGLQLRSKYSVW